MVKDIQLLDMAEKLGKELMKSLRNYFCESEVMKGRRGGIKWLPPSAA